MRLADEQVREIKKRAEDDERAGRVVGNIFASPAVVDRWNLLADREALVAEIKELERQNWGRAQHMRDAEQTLGKVLGYPWFKDDQKNFQGATEADGVCVGEHVVDTIAEEASRKITELRAENEELRRVVEAVRKLRPILRLITVRQVINAGDAAIDAVGLNPWCMNEGLAGGDEPINLYWLDAALEPQEASDAQDKADD